MSASRYSPQQMRAHADVLNSFGSLEGKGTAAKMLRQSASDAEALADLQRKVKELREAFRTHHDIAEAAKHMAIAKRDSQLQLAWGSVAEAWVNAVLLVDAIPALAPSPEQGA